MEIGKRLKQARLESGLSQRQLCGDVITRNMLSLIENGAAKPSMDTLAYLACRLGKPMGYFLEEDAVLSPNQTVMERARKAFAEERYEVAVEALEDYREPDPVFDWEAALLWAECAMELAEQALLEGRLLYAASLLEEAEQTGGKTPYFRAAQRKRWQLLRAKLRPEQGAAIRVDEELLLKAEAVIADDPLRAVRLLEAMDGQNTPGWLLLRGRAALAEGDHTGAAKLLQRAEAIFPQETAPLLEICFREMGDYKTAYEYAIRQRKMNE